MNQEQFAASFQHISRQTVVWGEMDALGHVNNAVYARYFESARLDFLRTMQKKLQLSQTGVGPVLAYISLQFKRPVRFPDELIIGSEIHDIGRSNIKLHHEIFSTSQDAVTTLCDSVLVMFDYEKQEKALISDELRTVLRHQGKSGGGTY